MDKIKKFFSASIIIFLITIVFSVSNTKAIFSYIETQIYYKNNSEFLLNGLYGVHDDIRINDVIETKDQNLKIVFNKIASLDISPKTKIVVLQIGNNPVIRLVSGKIAIQTIALVKVLTKDSVVSVSQGGSIVSLDDNKLHIANYYGANNVQILKNKRQLLDFNLPIKKEITIFHKIDKTNWKKIRYTKLKKELFYKNIEDVMLRTTFFPAKINLPSYKHNFLKNMFTISPWKKSELKDQEVFNILQDLKEEVENNSITKIKQLFQVMEGIDKNKLQILFQFQNLSQDVFTRHALDVELLKFFNIDDNSINTELKYLSVVLKIRDDKQVSKFVKNISNKIDQHENKLFLLEEDHALLNSFIIAYPALNLKYLVPLKKKLELSIIKSLPTDLEKIDFITSSYVLDLELINTIIQNSNGYLAQTIYDQMLINNTDFQSVLIDDYRKDLYVQEKNTLLLLNYNQEVMHSSAYNSSLFNKFKQNKEKENLAISLFAKQTVKSRKRPVVYDFSTVINEFSKYNLEVKKDNISFLVNGSKLLYIKLLKIPTDEIGFSCVFNPETKNLSHIKWEDKTRVPMDGNVVLSKFQESYLTLQKLELDKDSVDIKDDQLVTEWTMSESNNDFNYEDSIKKRMTKNLLREKMIDSLESNMSVFSNFIKINEAVVFDNTKDQVKEILINLKLDLETDKVLGVSLVDYPDRRIRIYDLNDMADKTVKAWNEEFKKEELRKNAFSMLKSVFLDLKTEKIKVKDLEKKIISFNNEKYDYKIDKNSEEVIPYYISGELNISTKILNSTTIYSTTQVKHFNKETWQDFMTRLTLLPEFFEPEASVSDLEEEIESVLNEVEEDNIDKVGEIEDVLHTVDEPLTQQKEESDLNQTPVNDDVFFIF